MSNGYDDRRKNAGSEKARGSSSRNGTNKTQQNQTSKKIASTSKRSESGIGTRARSGKNKAGKSQYITFYVVTLVVAVIVCLGTFLFVFSQITGNQSGNEPADPLRSSQQTPPDEGNDDENEDPPVIAIDEIGLTGVIININQSGRVLEILDIDSLEVLNFRADNSTTMQNRTGDSMSFAQFRPGDIVDARYREIGEPLTSISLAPAAWEHRNVSDIRVNPQGRTITVGDGANIYRYTERTISLFDNEHYDIADINPLNVVTLRGIGSDIWYIEISRSTGFINIVNGENIRDGIIEVDNNISMHLNEDGSTYDPIRVLSGNRQVSVRGSNIHDFNTAIDVSVGEQAILDLSSVQFLAGVVSFNINEPGASVTINGIPKRTDEPLILDYGRYELVVAKDGFITYETVFELNEPSLELTIRLERDVNRVNITVITLNAATNETITGARVYLDDVFIGQTPVAALVEEGNRMLSIRKEGFMSLSFMTDGRLRYDISLQELR